MLHLPENRGPFYIERATKVQGNATILSIEERTNSLADLAALQILIHILNQPFFTELRTQQQTGYSVWVEAEEIEGALFAALGSQSNTHDPRDLLARFELFLESFLHNGISPEVFEAGKDIQVLKLTDPAKNMEEMGKILFRLAFTYQGNFDRIQKKIDVLHQLSYSDFLTKTKQFLGRSNKRRLAILIRGTPSPSQFQYQPTCASELRKLGSFHARQVIP